MREVPDLLGHGDVTVTLNTYAHLMPGQLETSTSALSETPPGSSTRP
jgi:site-specific recombinase XerD